MILIHGCYKVAPKIKAYRSDWCNHCEKPVIANKVRRLYLLHLFWIPIFPLGIYKSWLCKECGENPRDRLKTSIALLVVAAILFGIMGFFSLLLPYTGEYAEAAWNSRFIFIGITAGFIYWIKCRLREPPVEKEIPPLNNKTCLVCDGRMMNRPNHYCLDCGVVREGE